MRIKSTLLIAVLLISLSPQSVNGSSKEPTTKKYSVTMKKAHLPTAPKNGTDDYRCFLLDPKVTEESIIRTIQFIPQRKNFVHHAIIFRVTDADLPQAIASDKNGTGWPCFGGSGLGSMLSSFVSTPWISSWAPGRGKDISPTGYGTPFKKGEQFVLQVHYNLLAANGGKIETDQSKIVMEAVPAKGTKIKQLHVELFPAPVELACPAGITGPLCDRKQSLIDLASRTSKTSAFESAGINILCGQDPFNPVASLTSRCDKVITSNFTVIAAAAHMHLLGRTLSLTLNPGKPTEKLILDVQKYNFDDQSGVVLKTPVAVKAGDTIRVTCTFDPTIRQKLPELKNLPNRYITWGEGSSDEMCLGVISATK